MNPIMSKHDPTAYHGKMDRLMFSKLIDNLLWEMEHLEATVDKELPDAINLQNNARNEGLKDARRLIGELLDKVYADDADSLDHYWKLTPGDIKKINDDYRKNLER